jgi:hypothetical protein
VESVLWDRGTGLLCADVAVPMTSSLSPMAHLMLSAKSAQGARTDTRSMQNLDVHLSSFVVDNDGCNM